MEDVQCQPEATRLALVWTVPTGDVDTCLVVAEQLAAGGAAQLIFRANTSGGALLLAPLAPAASYRLSLSVLGRNGLWSRAVSLVCATVPEGRCLWPAPPGPSPSPRLGPVPDATTLRGSCPGARPSLGTALPLGAALSASLPLRSQPGTPRSWPQPPSWSPRRGWVC